MKGRQLLTLGRPLGASLACAGLLLAGLAAVAVAWVDLTAATEERDAKADLLQRSAAAGRRARPAPGRPVDPFLSADTATLAAAKLDADLRAAALAAGLAVMSSRADLKPDEPGAAEADLGTRIEDQAVMEGQNEALQALLVRLETGDPVMTVDSLAVEPAEVAEGAPGDPQAPRLHVSLTLSAYWRAAARTPGRSG